MIGAVEGVDALLTRLRGTPDLRDVQILDGQDVTSQAMEGIAVGASREDFGIEFTMPSADLAGGVGERDVVTCLVWSGSGDTDMPPRRARVAELIRLIDAALAVDRTLGGVVAQAWITDGVVTQEQVGGALVTAELRIELTRF